MKLHCHILLFAAAMMLSLPAWADKGSAGRLDPRKYRSHKSTSLTKHKGKVRVRGGMVSRFKAWKQRNHRAKTRRSHGSIPRTTTKRRGSRTSRVWHKRSYERRGSRASHNRARYRVSGRRFSRGTIATLVRAGVLRRGKNGSLYVLGNGKSKRGYRTKYRPTKRLRVFAGRKIRKGDLKKLWKLASRTTPHRYPHGNVPLKKLWR